MKRYYEIEEEVLEGYFPRYRKEKRIVPVWWVKLLQWVFKPHEKSLDKIIEQAEERAFKQAFIIAKDTAHNLKEYVMQNKLRELGYKVESKLENLCRFHEEGDKPDLMPPPNEWYTVVKIIDNVEEK